MSLVIRDSEKLLIFTSDCALVWLWAGVGAGFAEEVETSMEEDMGRALAAWDCKMAGQTRTMLNTVLYNYIALEDTLSRAKDSIGHDQNPKFLKFYT